MDVSENIYYTLSFYSATGYLFEVLHAIEHFKQVIDSDNDVRRDCIRERERAFGLR